MTDSVAVYYDERFVQYDLGDDHPLHQDRILLHYELAKTLGVLSASGVTEPSFDSATEEHIEYAHTKEYITQIRTLSNREGRYILDRGDTSAFPGAYDIARLMIGASLGACDAVMTGISAHSWNPGGGLHHAHADRAAGFCIFNDVAIACHYLKRRYKAKRILYLDIDVHHGDGVQEQFYTDPGVLTLSIHQTGRTLFPNTGFTEELGEGEGRGYSVNLPLPPYTQDQQYLDAFEAIVPPIIEAYRPEVIVMQNGVDTHFQDELGQLILTTQSFSQITKRVHQLTHKYAHGRLVAVGGGGYSYYSVPRCWTIILAQLAGFTLPDEIPQDWQNRFNESTGLEPPTHVFDKTTPQLSQLDEARVGRFVSQSVQRVKDIVFPLLSIEK